jgi:peptide/nickel transport system substrate-binding protein
VTFKFISKDASRVAALLAGDVHLIDQVAPSDVKEIAKSGKAKVFSIASTRLVYVALDSSRDASPFVTDAKGQPMTANPLKDARIRVALSKLINRRLLVERLLDGSGEAAGQMVPEGVGGFDPSLKPPEQDVEGAKKLLVEAGHPNGFGLTLHSSNDRLPKDAAVAQAIGQMWARGGIKLNGVVALPYSVYATAATKREYSAFIFSFGTTTPNSAIALNNVLATYDAAAGMGAFNRARYANPNFDAALKRALTEFDTAKRNASLQEAARIAFNEAAIVPLYWQVLHWAARKGIGYIPSRDESTLAVNARIAR